MAEERAGGDIINDDGNMAQPEGRKIWEMDNSQRWAEEEHARMTVKAEFFYVDDGLVASTNPGWIQSSFNTLI